MYTCLVLLIAAIQHEELVGSCTKECDSAWLSSEYEYLSSVDMKENCLKQCLLKEGAKGCVWYNYGCFVLMKSVAGSKVEDEDRDDTCWRFISDKGKLQY